MCFYYLIKHAYIYILYIYIYTHTYIQHFTILFSNTDIQLFMFIKLCLNQALKFSELLKISVQKIFFICIIHILTLGIS